MDVMLSQRQPFVVESLKTFGYSENHCDLEVIPEDGNCFSAHQIVLAAVSPLLQSALKDVPSFQVPSIIVPHLNSDIVKIFLDFIYTGVLVCNNYQCGELIALMTLLSINVSDILSISSVTDSLDSEESVASPASINDDHTVTENGNGILEAEDQMSDPFASDTHSSDKQHHASSDEAAYDDYYERELMIPFDQNEYQDMSDSDEFDPYYDPEDIKPQVEYIEGGTDSVDSSLKVFSQTNGEVSLHTVNNSRPNSSDQATDDDAKISKKGRRSLLEMPELKPISSVMNDMGFIPQFSLSEPYQPPSHNKPFKCRICLFTGITHRQLRNHELTHFDPQRRHPCRTCSMTFASKSHLKRHETLHTGELKYKCKQVNCDSKFRTSDMLREHILNVHTLDFPYRCTMCLSGFLRPSSLKAHMTSAHRVS